MSHEWGRVAEAGKWQRVVPVWFMSVIVVAVASGIAVGLVRQTLVWTQPLQRFYLSAYARGDRIPGGFWPTGTALRFRRVLVHPGARWCNMTACPSLKRASVRVSRSPRALPAG